jgi:hypothetical protein
MFIDDALNPITHASAERNVSRIGRETEVCFAPLERGNHLAVARSINISPLWGEEQLRSVAPPS